LSLKLYTITSPCFNLVFLQLINLNLKQKKNMILSLSMFKKKKKSCAEFIRFKTLYLMFYHAIIVEMFWIYT